MEAMKILVAGVGNIFLGDDAFGKASCEIFVTFDCAVAAERLG